MVRYINERNVVDAADHVGADTMPNDIEDVSPAAPRVKTNKTWRNAKKAASGLYGLTVGPVASFGKSAFKGARKDIKRWGRQATKGDKEARRGVGKLRKGFGLVGSGLWGAAKGAGRVAFSPLMEHELLEYGITNYDLDNYDYFLVEKKTKKSRFFSKAGKGLDKGVDFVNTTGDTVDGLASDAVKGGRRAKKYIIKKAKQAKRAVSKEYKETKKALRKGYRENVKGARASYKSAKRNLKNFGKGAVKSYKNLENKLDDISDDLNDHIDDAKKELRNVGKAMTSNSAGKKRQLSGLSKEDRAKGSAYRKELAAAKKARKENSRNVKAAEREKQSELSESVIAELGSLYNSINMIPLVESIMNGEPATTQDIFGDIMNDKLAAAIELYRNASANDLFNEPSEFDDEDYEDGFEDAEVIAEWVDDPEDEDEEDFEFDEDDFEEEDEDALEEGMVSSLSNPAGKMVKFGIRQKMIDSHMKQSEKDPASKFQAHTLNPLGLFNRRK